MTAEPLRSLSVVIPAYNESARIELTLDRVMSCVEKQGWDAEVLVVDDGSSDSTPEIVHRWMDRYPRLHLVKNKRKPASLEKILSKSIEAMKKKHAA